MKKLYMISLGGKAQGANIEVHDVQFVVAENIEAAILFVKGHWYGLKPKLHMDSYKEIKGVAGYQISLTDERQPEDNRLFFTYLGGYNEEATQEIHDVRLMVAGSVREAKRLAMKSAGFEYTQRHVDSVVDIEKSLLMNREETCYLKLTPSTEVFNLTPDWFGYRPLDQA